ncbi:MAG: tRNA pseudouridine(55) synthase TruB, partial [Synergistaceae bacterium]|nr:tRNA pseudouridine(55) synthase TruB [Synergistaceae bacterium]
MQNVKKILARGTKIGHGGTLDSTAEGLLVLLTGGATRLSRLIMSLPKTYEVRIRLGSATSTDDASGDVIAESPWDFISTEMIDALLPGYMGWRAQIPPNISAVHV